MREMGTILLAEDNANDVLLTRLALQKARLVNPLVVVRDGEDAINYLSGKDVYADRSQYPFPFLLLLDLNMPKLDGFQVLEWLRQQSFRPNLSVAISTDSDNGPDVRRAYELGADSYLIKPPNSETLLALVQRLKAFWAIEPPEYQMAKTISPPLHSTVRGV
jgi:CheY-like chemotaxis protein